MDIYCDLSSITEDELFKNFGLEYKYNCLVCGGLARYSSDGVIPTHCLECKLLNQKAFVFKHTRCLSCDTVATFGTENGKPKYCTKHKTPESKDVVTVKCQCGARANYGYTVSRWCKKCKPDDTTLTRGNKCPCGKSASFGPPGGKRLTCKACKKNGYVQLAGKICCICKDKSASYGPEGGVRITCRKCRLPGYVLLRKAPKCQKCNSVANYGPEGGPRIRCGKHKASYVRL